MWYQSRARGPFRDEDLADGGDGRGAGGHDAKEVMASNDHLTGVPAGKVLRNPAPGGATPLSQGRAAIRDGDPRSVRPACQDPVDLPEQPPRDTG